MDQINKTKQIILQSRNKFEQKYINRDTRFYNNEESVKKLFETQVEIDLKSQFPTANIVVVPNLQINFPPGILKSFVSRGMKNDKKLIGEGATIKQSLNGPIIEGINKITKSEHIDTLIYIEFEDKTTYSVAIEFKHRNLLNSKGKKEGREFQESEAITKDLERLSIMMDPNKYSTDSGIKFDDFMFIFITDHKSGFVDKRVRQSNGYGYTIEFGEGVIKEFNGYRFKFKYKQIQDSYFLNFDSF